MKLIGDYKMPLVTCFVIALSICVALYGFQLRIGVHRFTKDSPANRTGALLSVNSSFYYSLYMSLGEFEDSNPPYSLLHDDFYHDSCPSAERIIEKAIRDIYDAKPSIAPPLIRLLFHDCFIEGCDASVLLEAHEHFTSEKEAIPNLSLKGFDVIDAIKLKLENVCPGIVSCADILVLATREAVLMAGGPLYLLKTGRRDSDMAFKVIAERQLIPPQASLSEILARFGSRGFNEREIVSLLGAHSIGITHCTFFEDRLYNFSGTGKPDPELNHRFIHELKTKCPFSASSSSPAPPLPTATNCSKNNHTSSGNRPVGEIDMSFDNEGGNQNFGTRYYKRLINKRGLMVADQQLTSRDETVTWLLISYSMILYLVSGNVVQTLQFKSSTLYMHIVNYK